MISLAVGKCNAYRLGFANILPAVAFGPANRYTIGKKTYHQLQTGRTNRFSYRINQQGA
jgi:hypothetical protein